MPVPSRLRRLTTAALPAVAAVVFAACDARYPNSVFTRHTDFNRDIAYLFDILIWLGTAVFVFVEFILLYAIFRYRRKSENDRPEHVHGNTTLEILWTAIPALILAFIAVPTVRTIFKTQARAKADALQVEVIGHQWWWEFRYPQYKITTANELYLPVGRTVNFTLRSEDVLHSFWIPQLGGKRDLITNHPNYLWFTPDSAGVQAWNGMCVEYCGASHANMRFKAFTVTPAEFAQWAVHQQSPAAFGAVAPPAPSAPSAAAGATGAAVPGAAPAAATAPVTTGTATSPAQQPQIAANAAGARSPGTTVATPNAPPAAGGANQPGAQNAPAMAGHDMAAMGGATVQQAGYVSFPRDKLPPHVIPSTPLPAALKYNDALVGDAERGRQLLSTGQGGCVGCHTINGNPVMMGVMGPNLTHVGSRTTIAGGLYPNDTKHLARWIKNARVMKPGVLMITLGKGEFDPVTKATAMMGLTDAQIADIVAYLQALK
ncbi:MAG: cytochrome c oxidase, subunit [Gemmatimonadetes bacterium]|nr:cytochrome c oxidase, subunit [Gemmatimonadota bacterium]